MTTDQRRSPARTYGGWRRARGAGLFGLDTTATLALLSAMVAVMLLASVSWRLALIVGVPLAAAIALMSTPVSGTSVGRRGLRRLRWTWGQARGHTTYRAVPAQDLAGAEELPGAWDLPGVLAPTRLLDVPDGRGGSFGLVWNRRTGLLTATVRCAAASTWLVDDADADGWVSAWHSWLASLGYLPMVRAVTVTVETAPEPGTTLQDAVLPRLAPNAPRDAVRLMRELLDRSPAAAADVDTRVSVTFDPASASHRLRGLDDATAEVNRQLTGLESGLSRCGVTVLGRADAAEVAGYLRSAFDPARRGDVRRLLSSRNPFVRSALTWGNAGPVAADERWDTYRHDSGVSVTWGWHEAPRQLVTAGVLTRLLSPGRFTKRVSLVYRPLPAGDAARQLEAQVNAAAFREAYRRAQHRDASARDLADHQQAHRAAAEEAQGAGVVLLSLYVTATVLPEDGVAEAVADVEARADQSKIRLRRLYGSQAAAFAATLPVGTVPGLTGGRR